MDVLDHHRQDMFYCVIGVFHIVASVVVCLRLYTRFFIVRGFGVDDWAIVAALSLLFAFNSACFIYIRRAMIGFHIWDVELIQTSSQKILGTKWNIVVEILHNPVVALTKISILLCYKRNTPTENYQRIIQGTIAFVIMHAIALFFAELFQCTPASFFWDKSILNGTCIQMGPIYILSGTVSILTDAWIMLMPQPVIWRLQLPLQKRLTLMIIFGLYSIVCVIASIRVAAIARVMSRDNGTEDINYSMVVIWGPIEASVAIICASIPGLRPLMGNWFDLMYHAHGTNSPTNMYGASPFARTRSSRYMKERGMGVQSHIKGGIGNGGMTSRLGMALGNDSEERFMASIMGIQKTTTIAVYDNLGTESASSAISTTSSGEDRILEVVVERFNEKSIDIITYA